MESQQTKDTPPTTTTYTNTTYSAPAADRAAPPSAAQSGGTAAMHRHHVTDLIASVLLRTRNKSAALHVRRGPARTWSRDEETVVALRRGCSD